MVIKKKINVPIVQDLTATPGFHSLPSATLQDLPDCAKNHAISAGQALLESGYGYHARGYMGASGRLPGQNHCQEVKYPPAGGHTRRTALPGKTAGHHWHVFSIEYVCPPV